MQTNNPIITLLCPSLNSRNFKMVMSEMPHCSYDVLISFQADTSVVVLIVLCIGAEFLCCCVRFHIFSVGRENSCSLTSRYVFWVLELNC